MKSLSVEELRRKIFEGEDWQKVLEFDSFIRDGKLDLSEFCSFDWNDLDISWISAVSSKIDESSLVSEKFGYRHSSLKSTETESRLTSDEILFFQTDLISTPVTDGSANFCSDELKSAA